MKSIFALILFAVLAGMFSASYAQARTEDPLPVVETPAAVAPATGMATQPGETAHDIKSDTAHEDPYKLVKMASLLALIFVVAVLLLRVARRNDSGQ